MKARQMKVVNPSRVKEKNEYSAARRTNIAEILEKKHTARSKPQNYLKARFGAFLGAYR